MQISVRPFTLTSIDAAIFLVAHASGAERYEATMAAYRACFDEIVTSADPKAVLRRIAAECGVTGRAFDKALGNVEQTGKLDLMTLQAVNDFGARGTPTFFLNGKPVPYDGTVGPFERAMQDLVF